MEIIVDILERISEEPVTPTRLATTANLPYDRLQPILEELAARGIVVFEAQKGNPRARMVTLTDRGRRLLYELRRLRRVLTDFGLDLL
jgi:predicted transcriptional regulator